MQKPAWYGAWADLHHYTFILFSGQSMSADHKGYKSSLITVQTGSKLEAFFAAFSRKTRVQRRTAYAKRIGIAVRKRYMSTPFEGAWTVTQSVKVTRKTVLNNPMFRSCGSDAKTGRSSQRLLPDIILQLYLQLYLRQWAVTRIYAGIKLRAASLACDHEGWAADTSRQVSGQPERNDSGR